MDALTLIRDALAGRGTVAEHEVAAAIAEIETDRNGITDRLALMARQREAALVACDDRRVDRIEVAQAALVREMDRLDAALVRLRRLLTSADRTRN